MLTGYPDIKMLIRSDSRRVEMDPGIFVYCALKYFPRIFEIFPRMAIRLHPMDEIY